MHIIEVMQKAAKEASWASFAGNIAERMRRRMMSAGGIAMVVRSQPMAVGEGFYGL